MDIQSEWRSDNDTSVDWTFTEDDGDIKIGVAIEIKFVEAPVTTGLGWGYGNMGRW